MRYRVPCVCPAAPRHPKRIEMTRTSPHRRVHFRATTGTHLLHHACSPHAHIRIDHGFISSCNGVHGTAGLCRLAKHSLAYESQTTASNLLSVPNVLCARRLVEWSYGTTANVSLSLGRFSGRGRHIVLASISCFAERERDVLVFDHVPNLAFHG